MEPSPQNSIEVGFWIRRISNMENKEEENGPCFKYDLFMADKFRDMQVHNIGYFNFFNQFSSY